MRYLPYVLKHLRASWIRTGSTVLAMAVCIFLFVTLQTFLAAIDAGLESASDRRLVTRNAVSLVFNLPLWYGERIRSVPGVRGVAYASWFGGVYQDPKNFFPNFAIDAERYLAMYPEYRIPTDQLRAFLRDRRGAVVGRDLAERFGWKIGDVFQLESNIPPYRVGGPLQFVVRAVYDADLDRDPGTNLGLMFFHWRYLYEATGRTVSPGSFVELIDDPSRAGEISDAIDALFANSVAQTRTETEGAFRAGFVAQIGPLAYLLNAIGLAVTFTILLVTANTMSMAVRERRREIAVLKTIGFPSGLVMGLILAESFVLGALGAGTGILLGRWVVAVLPGLPVIGDIMRAFSTRGVDPLITVVAFALGVSIAVAAGFVPAVLAYRLRTAELLRHA